MDELLKLDEIFRMIKESQKQIANGETLTDDEVWRKYEKEMTQRGLSPL